MTPSTGQTGPPPQGGWAQGAPDPHGVPAEQSRHFNWWHLPPPHQISELTSELTDERNTGESASQLLDAETAERLRAEKEMKELQVRAGLG